MTTMSKKMIGYALGRTVARIGSAADREMMAAGGNATFADLALRIVTSRQFRNRAGDGAVSAGPERTASSPGNRQRSSEHR